MRFLIGASILVSVGCSSAPVNHKYIDQVLVGELRVRRPPGERPSAQAGPGGPDYQANPLPDAKFDCVKPETLLQGMNLEAIANCLASFNDLKAKPYQAVYLLKRSDQPVWELEDADEPETPACLKQFLREIPVPREVVFEYLEPGTGSSTPAAIGNTTLVGDRQVQCYASRLEMGSGETFGVKLSNYAAEMKIRLPMDSSSGGPPLTADEARRQLVAWSLSALYNPNPGEEYGFKSFPMNDVFCQKCFGIKDKRLKATDPMPQVWPSNGNQKESE